VTISVSPNGKNVYETPTPDDEVLIATANGIIALRRSGGAWREDRRMLQDRHVGSMVVEPRSGMIFAGAHNGGLWASEDGGATWERTDKGIEFEEIFSMNSVQVGDETRIYAGTEPARLYVSKDLGNSWTDHPTLLDVPSVKDWTFPGPPHIGHVKTIAFQPDDPDTIYVGVEVGGAFKSTDGGKTFTELSGFYEDVHRLMTVPGRPNEVYIATGRGIYHSADAGGSFEKLSLPGLIDGEYHIRQEGISYPDALTILPSQPDLMFTAGAGSSPGGWRNTKGAFAHVGRSRDAGRTWEYINNGIPVNRANIEAMTMNVYPGGFSLIAGTTDGDVFFSDDEAETWTQIAQGIPPVSKGGHYRGLRPDLAAAH